MDPLARPGLTRPSQAREALRESLSLARKARRVQCQPFQARKGRRVNPLLARKASRVQTQPFQVHKDHKARRVQTQPLPVRLAPLELTAPRRDPR